ncbi:hypothetical protein CDIK_1138 [Cucumispora dikerogammari]|nr:hypothetical protein CDIK_1138 [Cucumispora dikerogammari]
MAVKDVVFQITKIQTMFISNSLQYNIVDVYRYSLNSISEIITSNNRENLIPADSDKKLTVENFKLKPNAVGNSILIPLFEITYKNYQTISPDFGNLLTCNNEFFEKNIIDGTGNICFSQVGFYLEGTSECIINNAVFIKCFVLNNTSTDTLYLYILLTFDLDIKFTVTVDSKIMLNRKSISSISFDCYSEYFLESFPLRANKEKIRETYRLTLPTGLQKTYFYLTTGDSGKIEIFSSDKNNKNVNINNSMAYKRPMFFDPYLIEKTKDMCFEIKKTLGFMDSSSWFKYIKGTRPTVNYKGLLSEDEKTKYRSYLTKDENRNHIENCKVSYENTESSIKDEHKTIDDSGSLVEKTPYETIKKEPSSSKKRGSFITNPEILTYKSSRDIKTSMKAENNERHIITDKIRQGEYTNMINETHMASRAAEKAVSLSSTVKSSFSNGPEHPSRNSSSGKIKEALLVEQAPEKTNKPVSMTRRRLYEALAYGRVEQSS